MTVATEESTTEINAPPTSLLAPVNATSSNGEVNGLDLGVQENVPEVAEAATSVVASILQHPVSEVHSRNLVDLLLEEDDRRQFIEVVAAATDVSAGGQQMVTAVTATRKSAKLLDVEDDRVCGWGASSTLVLRKSTSRPPGGGTRKKAGLKTSMSASSLDTGSTLLDGSVPPTHGGVVRCVSEDYVPGAHSHLRAAWKSNVEPGTYRYIVNNGIYRSTKFAALGGDWVTAKRSRGGANSEAENSSYNPPSHYRAMLNKANSNSVRKGDVKHAQTIIKRDLNRYSFTDNTAIPVDKRLRFEHSTVGSKDILLTGEAPDPTGDGKSWNYTKSTEAVHQQEHQQHLAPPWSSSSSHRDPELVKTTSDLFVEKFSSKIDALEKDDPTTSATPEGLPRPGTNPAAAVSSLQSTTAPPGSRRCGNKHLHPLDGTSLTPMSTYSSISGRSSTTLQADDISRDVFTVKPAVGIRASDQMPLKPLEKLTPQMQKKAMRGKNYSGGNNYDNEKHSDPSQKTTDNSNSATEQSSTNTPVNGAESPTNLSHSFMTAMSAYSQSHNQYNLMDINVGRQHHDVFHHSRSGPPTFRSPHSSSSSGHDTTIRNNSYNYRLGSYDPNNAGGKANKVRGKPRFHSSNQNLSDTDSLSSVKNALTLTNNDIEKMRMNQLAVRDYNRNVCARVKPTALAGAAATKPPPAGKRKGPGPDHTPAGNFQGRPTTLGLRPFNNSSAPPPPPPRHHNLSNTSEDAAAVGGQSDSDTESFLGGTSILTSRGVRERGMSLPEISGKRLPVATSNQRVL